MTLSTRARKTTERLVEKYGNTAVFTAETTAGTYSPTTGQVTGAVSTTYTVKVVSEEIPERFVDGDTIRSGDVRVYLAAKDLDFTPAAGQVFTLSGEQFTALGVKDATVQDSAVVHEIHARRVDGS